MIGKERLHGKLVLAEQPTGKFPEAESSVRDTYAKSKSSQGHRSIDKCFAPHQRCFGRGEDCNCLIKVGAGFFKILSAVSCNTLQEKAATIHERFCSIHTHRFTYES